MRKECHGKGQSEIALNMIPILRAQIIIPYDLALFREDLQKSLRDFFPFESLHLSYASDEKELEILLSKIPFSDRQRERARHHILEEKPFWDRVLNQALVPLELNGTGSFILCRITHMPKNVGTEEGSWLLGLARQVLKNSLDSIKAEAIYCKGKGIPEYVRMLIEGSPGPVNVLELSFYKWQGLSIVQIQKLLQRFFGSHDVYWAGYSEQSLWFILEGPLDNKLDLALRGCFSDFRQAKYTPRHLYLFDHIDHFSRLVNLRALATGLKAKVFSASLAGAFLNENGLGDGEFSIFSLLKPPSRVVSCIFVFSSREKRQEALSFVKDYGKTFNIGQRACFLMASSDISSLQNLRHFCIRLFSDLKKDIDSDVTAGFASPIQPLVTRDNVFFSSLLACHHAYLLGRGSMAVFDHITCNVHGDILLSWGDLTGAMACYRKGLYLQEDDVNLMNSLGTCLAEVSRLKDAEPFFKKALEVEPENEMALYNLSGIYLRQKRLEEAFKIAKKVLELKPSNIALLTRLLDILVAQKKWSEAYELSSRIQETAHSLGGRLVHTCAKVAFENGKWNEAKELLKKCLERRPDDLQSLLLLSKGFLIFEKDIDTSSLLFKKFWNKKGRVKGALKKEAMAFKKILAQKGALGLDNIRL